MLDINETLEEKIIAKLTMKEYVEQFEYEVQEIFYNLYGELSERFEILIKK